MRACVRMSFGELVKLNAITVHLLRTCVKHGNSRIFISMSSLFRLFRAPSHFHCEFIQTLDVYSVSFFFFFFFFLRFSFLSHSLHGLFVSVIGSRVASRFVEIRVPAHSFCSFQTCKLHFECDTINVTQHSQCDANRINFEWADKKKKWKRSLTFFVDTAEGRHAYTQTRRHAAHQHQSPQMG